MTDKEPLEEGDRVAGLTGDGTPAGSIGTVEQRSKGVNSPVILVHFDGEPEHSAKRVNREFLKKIGCEECDGTGIVAEKREGNLYRTACANCFEDGKQCGYFTDAEQYKLTAVV